MAVLLAVFVARASGLPPPKPPLGKLQFPHGSVDQKTAALSPQTDGLSMLCPVQRSNVRRCRQGPLGLASFRRILTRKLRHCRHRPTVSPCCALSSGATCGVVARDLWVSPAFAAS